MSKIYHPLEKNHQSMSLVYRWNPFTKQWEFWDFLNEYAWRPSETGPDEGFDDITVSYERTWCDPIYEAN